VAAVEMTLHKRWRIYERHVKRFIAPSHFLLNRAVDFGLPEQQFVHIPHFLFADERKPTPAAQGEYALFLGRLSEEKGLPTLLAAAQKAKLPLRIVGEGPMQTTIKAAITQGKMTHVQLAGYLTGQALVRAVTEARFTVIPSECYEVFPQVIIESFAQSKPVIATAIGGIPEVVDDGIDGLLVPPGDDDAVADALHWLWIRPQVATKMGLAGRAKVEELYDAPPHYQRIVSLYQEVAHQTSN
jgi:glycosyltransferase involved in cell wall biosynthesis